MSEEIRWSPVYDEEENYFGGCPVCLKSDGYINIGIGHWFYCKAHRVCWWAGSRLFSSYMEQTEEEKEKIFDELDFGSFRDITGWSRKENDSETVGEQDELPF